ncbi:hypothetical protein BA060_00040 [Brucella sp. B13-0095]|nr:hypothetical protein BA060_00040 [Brucella sp. B13-0095]
MFVTNRFDECCFQLFDIPGSGDADNMLRKQRFGSQSKAPVQYEKPVYVIIVIVKFQIGKAIDRFSQFLFQCLSDRSDCCSPEQKWFVYYVFPSAIIFIIPRRAWDKFDYRFGWGEIGQGFERPRGISVVWADKDWRFDRGGVRLFKKISSFAAYDRFLSEPCQKIRYRHCFRGVRFEMMVKSNPFVLRDFPLQFTLEQPCLFKPFVMGLFWAAKQLFQCI